MAAPFRPLPLLLALAAIAHCQAFSQAFAPLLPRHRSSPLSSAMRPARARTPPSLGGLQMLRNEYDLVVVGAGPTGLTAALSAASAGKTAVIIDATPKRQVQFSGPTGLYSKALRDTAKKIDVGVLRNMGVRDTAVWRQVQEMTSEVLKESGLSNLAAIQASNIPHLRGTATMTGERGEGGAHCLDVTFLESDRKIQVQGQNVLIATGSSPWRLDTVHYDDARVFDSDTIKTLNFLPKTVAIVGAGIIAIEYAKIFSRLDCKVTLIVRGKSLATALTRIGIDPDIALELQKDLCLNKVRIIFDAEIDQVESLPPGSDTNRPLTITLKQPGTGVKKPHLNVKSHVLMTATGRAANTKGLELEAAGVELDKGGNVAVNGFLQTTLDNVYAAGDVLGPPSLASTGIEQALAVSRTMFGLETEGTFGWRQPDTNYDPRSLMSDPLKYPIGIWTLPEMAFIGSTQQSAKENGLGGAEGVGEATAYYGNTIRGKVQGLNFGFMKLVYTKPEGKVIGVHILGEDACELIHYGTALAQSGKTVQSVLGTMFAAVTFHELFKAAASKAVLDLDKARWIKMVKKTDEADGKADGKIQITALRRGLVEFGVQQDDIAKIILPAEEEGQEEIKQSTVISRVMKLGLKPRREKQAGSDSGSSREKGGGEGAGMRLGASKAPSA